MKRTIVRTGWAVVDQGLSSFTNFVLGVLVARAVTPKEFGTFSLGFGIYIIALMIGRALANEPLIVRYSAVSKDAWRAATASAAGTAVVLGIVVGAICILVEVTFSTALDGELVALGLTLPGLLLQDSWRYAFCADGRGQHAFINDLIWALLLIPSLLFVAEATDGSSASFILAWGVTASISAGIGSLQAKLLPQPRRLLFWLRTHLDLGSRYFLELVALTAAIQLSLFGIGAVAGLREVAAFRAAQILFGPLNVLFLGFGLAAVPEGVVLRQAGELKGLLRSSRLVSVVAAVTAATWGLAIVLAPNDLGSILLGSNWEQAQRVVPPLAVGMAGLGSCLGSTMGVRVLMAVKRSLRVRLLFSPLVLATTLGGAAVAGAYGAAWGMAAVLWIESGLWWREYRGALRDAARNHREHVMATP